MVSGAAMEHKGLAALKGRIGEIDAALDRFLTPPEDCPSRLAEAMRYSALAKGKRLRPFIALRACELCGGEADQAMPAAVAVECVHAFSLVHDDLPAMDDDDLRRGQPTNHKVFGEAVAILAGDALLALAFEIIARHTPRREAVPELIAELASAAGWTGIIGGQTADILGEERPPDPALVEFIDLHKTARLFEGCARMGAIAAGAAREAVDALGVFGRHFGLAFQIADDLLDLTSTADQMGKAVGKDLAAGKQTYPRVIGVEASLRKAEEHVRQACQALEPFGSAADDLRSLAAYVLARRS